jgi:K+/H+ antiporter YhaU regulatory subunit KhtT
LVSPEPARVAGAVDALVVVGRERRDRHARTACPAGCPSVMSSA